MFDDPRWGDDPRDRDDDPRDRDRDEEWLHPGRQRDLGDGHDHRPDDHAYDSRDRDGRDREDERANWGGALLQTIVTNISTVTRATVRTSGGQTAIETRATEIDPRDVFMRELDLPRGRDREIVHDARGREYTLRGSETRTLSTVGAFRVVPARELRDHFDRPADPRDGDLRHLREQRLIETMRIPGHRDSAVVLTDRGRDLLEVHRDRDAEPRQGFYAGLKRERELEHDAQIFGAYLREAERLAERDAQIERVVLSMPKSLSSVRSTRASERASARTASSAVPGSVSTIAETS
jgi:hypothetical protein